MAWLPYEVNTGRPTQKQTFPSTNPTVANATITQRESARHQIPDVCATLAVLSSSWIAHPTQIWCVACFSPIRCCKPCPGAAP